MTFFLDPEPFSPAELAGSIPPQEAAAPLTVSALTFAIKERLEKRFCRIAVQGEVSNAKLQSSGHLYFTLKDSQAQISAVLFRGAAARLALLPRDGDQVIVYADLTVYPPGGRYQLIVRALEPLGVGALLLKLEALKKEIARRGWSDPSKKKALPPFPRVIGVVTSPTGAVIRDIVQVLGRRFSGITILLNPVKVQGEGAAEEIAQAIEQFNRYQLADLLIVGRGGGSIEDLWPFNEEVVAEAIFKSTIPIISAVGHETDHSIADLVADVRAPTPSAAAEMAIASKEELIRHLKQLAARTIQWRKQYFRFQGSRLMAVARHPLFLSPMALLATPWRQLDHLTDRLHARIAAQLERQRQQLAALQRHLQLSRPQVRLTEMQRQLSELQRQLRERLLDRLEAAQSQFSPLAWQQRLTASCQQIIKSRATQLEGLARALQALNPHAVVKRGYAILTNDAGEAITSVKQLRPDQLFSAQLSDGSLSAVVTAVGKAHSS